jgi:hypothetical protein
MADAKKTLRPFQRHDVDLIKRNNLRVLLASAPGTGKAQPVSAKVLTPEGWKRLGALRVGDEVVDPDGGRGQVLGVYPQGEKPVFRVMTAEGASTRCCDDHLWSVWTRDARKRGRDPSVRPLREIRERVRVGNSGGWSARRWFLPRATPFDHESGPLALDPYLLGVLLGDGCLSAGGVVLSNSEPRIQEAVRARLPPGYVLRAKSPGQTKDFRIAHAGGRRGGQASNPVTEALRSFGLLCRSHEKSVPSAYLWASAGDRLALLHGLLDTDGTCGRRGKASFSSTAEALARAVVHLVRSLGGSATIRDRVTFYTYKGEKRTGRKSWRVMVRLPVNPFRFAEKKAARWVTDGLANGIESVEPAGTEECVCIRVSTQRSLYITDDYIVTHNTPIAVTSLLETGRWSLPALVVCPASVTRNWKREFKSWAPGLRVQVVEDMSTPLDKHANVYVTSWALIDPREMDFHSRGLRAVFADEAHLAKNPDALRSQALYRLTRGNKGLLLMTGTPIVNTRDEMEALTALYGTQPPMIRRLLEDVAPEIPPKKRSYLYIKLRDRAQREYDQADDDFETWLRREKERLLGEGMAEASVERAMAAEAFTKMGYLRRLLGESKVPAAADWIARAVRIGEPVVVFVEHQAALKKLVKSLRAQRIRHAVLEGKTPQKKRQKYIDQFQANRFPVLICTKAGKEGITLHAARHLLFVERFYTSADEEQAEDRIRRIGQTHKTTIWYLHAAGTIDDRLDTIVRSKRVIIRQAIRAESTAETTLSNVEALVRSWEKFIPRDVAVTTLGRGDPLPPLPPPTQAHAIVFTGSRWKTKSAASWCRMHGYLPSKRVGTAGRFRLIVHPIEVFKPREFTAVPVCGDVKVIVGVRLSAKNEKLMRRRLHRMQG